MGKLPRADVPQGKGTDVSARNRELYLRAILFALWKTWYAVEVDAPKLGYGVLQVLWKPAEGDPTPREIGAREGSQEPTKFLDYTRLPWKFRAIPPEHFFPLYRTFDEPDDFMFVFRYEPERLIEDLEEKYKKPLRNSKVTTSGEEVCELLEYWDSENYVLMALTSEPNQEDSAGVILVEEKHPYGRPPFFVQRNYVEDGHEDPTYAGTLSDVELIEDLNAHLNMMVSLEATALGKHFDPPAIYKAGELGNLRQDPNEIRLGSGEVIPIGNDEDLSYLIWEGVPKSMQDHRDSVMSALQDLSGLPRAAFGATEEASGIGMRLSYASLELILSLKVPLRVEVLESALKFMLDVTKKMLKGNRVIRLWSRVDRKNEQTPLIFVDKDMLKAPPVLFVTYPSLLPRDRITEEQHTIYRYKTGLLSLEDALDRFDDVRDPRGAAERILEDLKNPLLHPELAQQGQSPPEGGGNRLQPPPMSSEPPVPTSPSKLTNQNIPFLERGQAPGFNQVFPGGPGVNLGPSIEGQP